MSRLPPLDYPPRLPRPLHPRPRRYRVNASDAVRLLAIVSTMVLAVSMVSLASASTISIIPFAEDRDANWSTQNSDYDNPFNSPGLVTRLQQIWHVDFFGPSEIELTGIAFRLDGDPSGEPTTVDLDSLEVKLGTTTLSPTALTGNYATNVAGVTFQTVFDGPASLGGTRDPGASGDGMPNPFDIVIDFADTPFVYDPGLGQNLVAEIMGLDSSGGGFAALDAAQGTQPSSPYGLPVNADGQMIAMAAGLELAGSAIVPRGAPQALVVEFLATSGGTTGGGDDGGGGPGGGMPAVPLPPSLLLLASSIGIWGLATSRRRALAAG